MRARNDKTALLLNMEILSGRKTKNLQIHAKPAVEMIQIDSNRTSIITWI